VKPCLQPVGIVVLRGQLEESPTIGLEVRWRRSGGQLEAWGETEMPQTLSEKILSAKVGKAVKAGDIVIADVDLVFVVDSSGPLSFREMADMGLERVAHPERTVLFMDHNVPSPRAELSQEQDFLRQMAAKHELRLYDVGDGICHQLVLEELGVPGGVTIGADSHTCTAGALCNFGTGMGASDVAVVMGTGKTWLRVPESIEVRLQGRLPVGVFAKDIALELERIVTAGGGTYMALEFTGPTVAMLSVSERATLANMAVEMGREDRGSSPRTSRRGGGWPSTDGKRPGDPSKPRRERAMLGWWRSTVRLWSQW